MFEKFEAAVAYGLTLFNVILYAHLFARLFNA
jgi:hypothetical protein